MQHVWIFQLATALTDSVKSSLLKELNAFVAVWKAHGTPVPGMVEVRHDRFVIVQAEPGHASGCSIDSMNKGVNEILANHGVVVLGPENVFFREKDGFIASIDFKEAKAAILQGRLNADSTIFDSTMSNKNDLNFWEVSLESTWLKRLLPQPAKA
jgi:hypothetical protein